jgi:2-deoxy-D-gluconate 3-dehydrogenase
MTDLFSLSGRTAIVTGANTGIGQAIAIALAQAGADIAVVCRTKPVETASAVQATGRREADAEGRSWRKDHPHRVDGGWLAR